MPYRRMRCIPTRRKAARIKALRRRHIRRFWPRSRAIRKTPHPVHGRVLQWTLTRRGGTLLDKCRRHVKALERRLMAGLSAKAQVTIRRWLSKIAAELQQDG